MSKTETRHEHVKGRVWRVSRPLLEGYTYTVTFKLCDNTRVFKGNNPEALLLKEGDEVEFKAGNEVNGAYYAFNLTILG